MLQVISGVQTLSDGITCSAEQHGRVGDTQQRVVQEALQHGRVHLEVCGQVLGGDGRPADEQGQALTHGQRLGQLPVGEQSGEAANCNNVFNVLDLGADFCP